MFTSSAVVLTRKDAREAAAPSSTSQGSQLPMVFIQPGSASVHQTDARGRVTVDSTLPLMAQGGRSRLTEVLEDPRGSVHVC